MPLDIIVVGAGIAGLCAAVSLRQAGHSVKVGRPPSRKPCINRSLPPPACTKPEIARRPRVPRVADVHSLLPDKSPQILEKSQFAVETGAAVFMSPNGTRVLEHLGFSFSRARGCEVSVWQTLDGISLANIATIDFADQGFGAPAMTVHRVDLHRELLRLVSKEDGDVKALTLQLGSRVASASAEEGVVELEDGTRHRADLVVAADGLHSVLRDVALGYEAAPATPTGMSAFRFLLPTATMRSDPKLAELLQWKIKGPAILADTQEVVKERHMVWYDCQDGEVQNFVGIHPTRREDKTKQDFKNSMLEEFSHFHPNIVQIINAATDVTCWPLSIHMPFSSWSRGKIVLIGDAAHPMLPFGGQGANQAIEDAGALGCFLKGIDDPSKIPQRMALFEKVRRKRASRTQILSKVRVGREKEVRHELEEFADPPGSAVPSSFPERNRHDFSFDVLGECDKVLRAQGEVF